MGLQARLMSQALRKLTGIVSKSRTCLIFINQTREKIGVMFGKSGNHHRRARAEILRLSFAWISRRIQSIKEGDLRSELAHARKSGEEQGSGAPFREAEFDITLRRGHLVRRRPVLGLGVTHNHCGEEHGAWFPFWRASWSAWAGGNARYLFVKEHHRHPSEAGIQRWRRSSVCRIRYSPGRSFAHLRPCIGNPRKPLRLAFMAAGAALRQERTLA